MPLKLAINEMGIQLKIAREVYLFDEGKIMDKTNDYIKRQNIQIEWKKTLKITIFATKFN